MAGARAVQPKHERREQKFRETAGHGLFILKLPKSCIASGRGHRLCVADTGPVRPKGIIPFGNPICERRAFFAHKLQWCFRGSFAPGKKKTAGWTRPLLPLLAGAIPAACPFAACLLCRDGFCRPCPVATPPGASRNRDGGAKVFHGGILPCPSASLHIPARLSWQGKSECVGNRRQA